MKIKFSVSYLAASNVIVWCIASVIRELFNNKYFNLLICFCFFRIFLIFNIILITSEKVQLLQSQFNIHNPTVHNPTIVLILRAFFQDFFCCDTFYNLYHYWSGYFWFRTMKKCTYTQSLPIASKSKQYLLPILK